MAGPASVYGRVPHERLGAEAPPDIGLFDTRSWGAGFDMAQSGPDIGANETRYLNDIAGEIEQALRGQGYKVSWNDRSAFGTAVQGTEFQRRFLGTGADNDGFWRAFADARAKNPQFMAEYGDVADTASLRERARRAQREDYDRALATAGRLTGWGRVGAFLGGLGGAYDDFETWAGFGLAAKAATTGRIAREVVRAGGRETAINAGIALVSEPLVRQSAERLGIERTAADAAWDIGIQGAAGGLLGGASGAVDALRVRRIEANTLADREAVESLLASIGEPSLTPDERAAVNVLNWLSDTREASPFAATPAGDQAHLRGLAEADRRIAGGAPVPRETVKRSELLAGTADPARLRMPEIETYMARTRQAESGGKDRAKNPNSSASGRYQFTMPTWLSYYKRVYGKSLSNDAIWAKRFDPAIQDVLMRQLTLDNARMLEGAGLPASAGNLYMLHFAGPKGVDVLRAAPSTPIEQVLTPAQIRANGFLRGKTAGQVAAWAHRKMGGPAPARTDVADVPPVEMAEADLPPLDYEPRDLPDFEARQDWLESSVLPMLPANRYGTPEEHARAQLAIWREQDAMDGFARVVDDPPPPPEPVEVPAAPPMRARGGEPHVLSTIAEAGGIRDDGGHDLVGGRNIPKFRRDAGAIITRDGRSIDEIGEVLWEKGYFGPPSTTPRPREAEVLDLIEEASRRKVYLPERAAERMEAEAQTRFPSEEEVRWELEETARDFGVDLDPRTIDDAMARRARGETVEDALGQAIAAAAYRDLDAPAGLARFDDPDGEGIAEQIDSIEHDLRMAAEGEDLPPLWDDGGSPVALADLLDDLDSDIRAAEAMRACMAPVREAAE